MKSEHGTKQLPTLPDNPAAASELLLRLDGHTASELFQQLPVHRQLAILDATPDPRDREELYYLVPDCTDLIRQTSVESLLEMISTGFGTGLACGILSAVSPEQFREMFERTAIRDGLVDRDIVTLWVAELTELEVEELSELLRQLDVETLAELFRGRVDVDLRYKGLIIDSGLVELEHVEFADEQVRLMGELLWAADPELFIAVLRLLLTEREPGSAVAVEEGVEAPEESEAEPQAQEDWLAQLTPDQLETILPPPNKPHPDSRN